MSHHFVLSDFENVNVQFKEIGALQPGECRIKLFIGQSQTRLSVELFEIVIDGTRATCPPDGHLTA